MCRDNLDVYIKRPPSETVVCVVAREHYFSKVQAHIVAPILQTIMEICKRERTEACCGVQLWETCVRCGSDYT